MMDEEPKDWDKSSTSQIIKFPIEGIDHEFKMAILKFDSWDRYDDDHVIMMDISIFYNGPFEYLDVKPLFYLENSGKLYGHILPTETLRKGMYSAARVFSGGVTCG